MEVVATDRMGGGVEGRYWEVPLSLDLWSIDPKALLAGSAQWRFEGCFFECRASMPDKMSNGCHPAAAMIDEQERVQHIFVHLGSPSDPAGIVHLKRTLDTPKLAAFLQGQVLFQNHGCRTRILPAVPVLTLVMDISLGGFFEKGIVAQLPPSRD